MRLRKKLSVVNSTRRKDLSEIASLAANGLKPISGRAQWPFVTVPTLTTNTQFQTIYNIRCGCTGNVRLLWVNPTATAIVLKASVRVGFLGTKERVLKNGSENLTIPAYGKLVTDFQSFGVTTGQFVYVQSFVVISTSQTLPSGYIGGTYNPESATVAGAANPNRIEGGLRGVSDRTMEVGNSWNVDLAVTDTDLFGSCLFGPYAVLGKPTQTAPFITFIGDSKTQNVSPDYIGGGRGWVSYGMGPVTGQIFQNLSVSGDALSGFLADNSLRKLHRELLDFGGVVLNHYGTNSLGVGTPAATELAEIFALKALLLPETQLVQSTCDPVTSKTSGDWATITEEQQVEAFAGGISRIQTFNTAIRNSISTHATGLIDLAAAVESSTNSAKWAADTTGDGVHQNDAANVLQGAVLTGALPLPYGPGPAPSFNFGDIDISGVVAHYKFNGNGNDAVSGSYNLSAVGTPTYETGKFGNCVVVDGTNYLSGAPTLNIGTGSASWSMWIRNENWSIGDQSVFWKNYSPRIIAGNGGSGGFMTGGIVVGADLATLNGFQSGALIPAATWHHVVMVLNRSTQKLNYWINGIKSVTGGDEADTTVLAANITNSDNVLVGGNGSGVLKVDSISVFNKALSNTEIGQLYNSGAGRDYTG